MEAIFRSLVVAMALLTVLFWSMPYVDYIWLSVEQLQLLEQGGLGSVIPGRELAYWGELAVWLGLSVGLFFYIKAARIGFLVFYCIVMARSFFDGVQILSPYEAAISSILGLADGAILALAYFTSIAAKFERNS